MLPQNRFLDTPLQFLHRNRHSEILSPAMPKSQVRKPRSRLAKMKRFLISENDEVSRIAFCENLEWSCISILLGLVTCAIDVNLKADIVLTISALAKTAEIANTIWRNLEITQIIPTVPTTNNYRPRGVQVRIIVL